MTDNKTKNIDFKKIFRIVLYVFLGTLTTTIVLAYLAFYAPPPGEISESVLKTIVTLLAANSAFEAFVLGFLGIITGRNIKIKTRHSETEIDNSNPLQNEE